MMYSVMEIARFFSPSAAAAQELPGAHNRVYHISGEIEFILRLARESERSLGDVLSEIDFKNYLSGYGIPLDDPIPSIRNRYALSLEMLNGRYVAAAFERLHGLSHLERGTDSKALFISAGQVLGKVHSLSMRYVPPSHRRWAWDQSRHLAKADALFARKAPRLAEAFLNFKQSLLLLPKDPSVYGLIHGDYYYANYLSNNDEAVILDFDECEYSWYLYDIAVCLYHPLVGNAPMRLEQRRDEAVRLFTWLMEGYSRTCTLDTHMLAHIEQFFRLRDFVLLAMILEKEATTPWQDELYKSAYERAVQGNRFISVDFSALLHRMPRPVS